LSGSHHKASGYAGGYLLGDDAAGAPSDDRDLIVRHVERIVVKSGAIELHLRDAANDMNEDRSAGDSQDTGAQQLPPAHLSLPWARGGFAAVKGVLYAPSPSATMTPETSEALLVAIAKARGWTADLLAGGAANLAQDCAARGQSRTACPFPLPACLRVAADLGVNYRPIRACRPHGHRSRQGVALLLDRTGATRRMMAPLAD
jgi:hypothetical protein